MKVWFWPLTIATLSTAGLIIGLVCDGGGDLFAWVTLGIPVAVAACYGWGKRAPDA